VIACLDFITVSYRYWYKTQPGREGEVAGKFRVACGRAKRRSKDEKKLKKSKIK